MAAAHDARATPRQQDACANTGAIRDEPPLLQHLLVSQHLLGQML